MKRNRIYVMAGLLMATFVLTGCALRGAVEESESTETDSSADTTSETSTEEEFEIEPFRGLHIPEKYMKFEEVLDAASHVVLAKCVDKYTDGKNMYAVFEPIEVFKGSVGEEIRLKGDNKKYYSTHPESYEQYSYQDNFAKYEEGKEYVLVTEINYLLYSPYDYHRILGDICIPKDSIEKSTMYGELNLAQASQAQEDVFDTYDKLIAYIRDIIAQDTTEFDHSVNYIRSNKLEEIVEQTEVILKIKVISQVVFSEDRVRCRGTVVDTLKGEEVTGEVVVYVPLDSVVKGEEYIVLVKPFGTGGTGFNISSKHSVYPVTDTQKVQEIEALIEQSK